MPDTGKYKKACDLVGLVGVSTHSFRRTALTQMCSAGIPLRHIQEISGHLKPLNTFTDALEAFRTAMSFRFVEWLNRNRNVFFAYEAAFGFIWA